MPTIADLYYVSGISLTELTRKTAVVDQRKVFGYGYKKKDVADALKVTKEALDVMLVEEAREMTHQKIKAKVPLKGRAPPSEVIDPLEGQIEPEPKRLPAPSGEGALTFLEKPEKRVVVPRRLIESVECPMISTQQILDRLAKVKAIVEPPEIKFSGDLAFSFPLEMLNKPKPREVRLAPQSEKIAKDILDTLATVPPKGQTVEVEASIGHFYGSSFSPGVTDEQFSRLKTYLKASSEYTGKSVETSMVRIDGDIRETTVNGKVTYQTKTRSQPYNSPHYDYRISTSIETTPTAEAPESFNPTIERHRVRIRYKNSANNAYIDLTKVTEIVKVKGTAGKGDYTKTFPKNEVEVELRPVTAFIPSRTANAEKVAKAKTRLMSLETLYLILRDLLIVVQNLPFKVDQKGQPTTEREDIVTRQEYARVVRFHNNSLRTHPLKEGYLASRYQTQPINLKRYDLVDTVQRMAVTSKMDGERKILIVAPFGTYAVSRGVLEKIGHGSFVNFIMDCEYTVNSAGTQTYWPFDVLAAGHEQDRGMEDFRSRPLIDRDTFRTVRVQEFFGKEPLKLWHGIRFNTTKPYVYPTVGHTFAQNLSDMAAWERKTKRIEDIEFDGFIFQPLGKYDDTPKKWKPSKNMTIDFVLRRIKGSKNEYQYLVYNGTKGTKRGLVPPKYYVEGKPIRPTLTYDGPSGANQFVAECWLNDNYEWEVLRLRPDKPTANEKSVAKSVWDDIINPIEDTTLAGKDLVMMRFVHNRTKEKLLDVLNQKLEKKPKVILDIGSGQGGDLDKWEAAGFTKVWALEPSKSMREKLSGRLAKKKRSTKVDLIPHGIEDSEAVLKTISKGDAPNGASAFFSLTFLGGSKKKLKAAASTISEVLPLEGQTFVGIVMDGAEVHQLLDLVRPSDGGPARYAPTVKFIGESNVAEDKLLFSIEETGKTKAIGENFTSRQIGVTIPGSFVQSDEGGAVIEWTFPFDYFKKLMSEHGFQYLESESGYLTPSTQPELMSLVGPKDPKKASIAKRIISKSYQNLPQQSQVFSSLQRYFVFQRLPKPTLTAKFIELPGQAPLPSTAKKGKIGAQKAASDAEILGPKNFYEEILGVDITNLRLKIYPTVQDSSAIFSAFLELTDADYYSPSNAEITTLAKRLAILEKKKPTKEMAKTSQDLETARASLAKALVRLKRQAVKKFRTETLPKFIEDFDHAIPDRIITKYGSLEKFSSAVADLKEEVPAEDALDLLSIYAATSENSEAVGLMIYSVSGKVLTSGCEEESLAKLGIIFQTLSPRYQSSTRVEEASVQEVYYPVLSVSAKGKETRLLDLEDDVVKEVWDKACGV